MSILVDLHEDLVSQQPIAIELSCLEIWFMSGGFELIDLEIWSLAGEFS